MSVYNNYNTLHIYMYVHIEYKHRLKGSGMRIVSHIKRLQINMR